MKRIEREKLQRRQEIINAAKKLFYEKGFDNVKMEEVAQVSEFTRKTIYTYFQSKTDLFFVILKEAFENFWNEFSQSLEEDLSGYDLFFRFGLAYFDFYKQNPEYYLLINYFDLSMKKDLEKYSSSTLAEWEKIDDLMNLFFKEALEKGIENGQFRQDLKRDLSVDYYWKSVFGIIHQYVFHPKYPDECYKIELEYLLRGFLK